MAESQKARDCPKRNWCRSSDLEDDVGSMWDPNDWENEVDVADGEHYTRTCINKYGTITPMHIEGNIDPVLTADFMLPIEGGASDAAFAGQAFYYNVTFEGFD